LRYACALVVTVLGFVCGNAGPVFAQVGPGIYDDRDSHITYSGTWSQATQTGDYQGTHTWSNTAGSTFSLTFTGTEVTYVFPLYSSRGYAKVSIDGNVVTSQLDAYASTWVMQKLATYSGLSNATHTITVAVLGTHDSQPQIQSSRWMHLSSAFLSTTIIPPLIKPGAGPASRKPAIGTARTNTSRQPAQQDLYSPGPS
jgi:hypothetical protein